MPELQLLICLFLLRATDIANLLVVSYHNLVNTLWLINIILKQLEFR